MELRILGPLMFNVGGREVVGGGRVRALLARLLLARGHAVALDTLISAVWDGELDDHWLDADEADELLSRGDPGLGGGQAERAASQASRTSGPSQHPVALRSVRVSAVS